MLSSVPSRPHAPAAARRFVFSKVSLRSGGSPEMRQPSRDLHPFRRHAPGDHLLGLGSDAQRLAHQQVSHLPMPAPSRRALG